MRNRLNKTEKNLQQLWDYLDQASENLNNVRENLHLMVDIPVEIEDKLEQLDITLINSIKNDIEKMIERKKKMKKGE